MENYSEVRPLVESLNELGELLSGKARKLVVSQYPVNLTSTDKDNQIYILELVSRSTAAGGRAGGFGERRAQKIYCFSCKRGVWTKKLEISDEEKIQNFELPYHASGMDVVLPDGRQIVVAGVVDPEFIKSYNQLV